MGVPPNLQRRNAYPRKSRSQLHMDIRASHVIVTVTLTRRRAGFTLLTICTSKAPTSPDTNKTAYDVTSNRTAVCVTKSSRYGPAVYWR